MESDLGLKTVVTGGAGFIGSHLVKELLDSGRDVLAVDDMSRGNLQNLEDLRVPLNCVVQTDLRDYGQALKAIKGAETVFHLAARVGSVEYLHKSEMAELVALQDNLVIDVNILRACVEVAVRRIVYTSSVSVYPMDLQREQGVVLSEDDPWHYDPEGGYGWAKLLGEIQLGWIKDIDIGIARIFNVYGEGEPLDKTAHVVPALIRKAIMYPKEDFIVWGDGNQSRCLIYVTDCVDALTRLEEKASNPPLIVNVGSDRPVEIKEIAEKIVKISGKDIDVRYDPKKPVGPLSRTANIQRAKSMLGWKPKVRLEDGLKTTYMWAERAIERYINQSIDDR
jgi:nucleoside-diphosphate-sugar epimerase